MQNVESSYEDKQNFNEKIEMSIYLQNVAVIDLKLNKLQLCKVKFLHETGKLLLFCPSHFPLKNYSLHDY